MDGLLVYQFVRDDDILDIKNEVERDIKNDMLRKIY